MRIKMLVSQAGPHISRMPRCVYDLQDEAEALRLIESGAAVASDEPATVTAVETTEPVVKTPAAEEAPDEVVQEERLETSIEPQESEPQAETKAKLKAKRGK